MSNVVNVVSISASGDLNREVDIQTLAEEVSLPVAEYKSEMNATLFRFEEDGELMILYMSGKYILRGGDDFNRMYEINEEFLQELSKAGLHLDKTSLTVKNVVSVGETGKSLDLNKLAIKLGLENVEYEPEQFPGLVYRPKVTNCVLLIFSSGKLVITGGKSKEETEEAFELFVKTISNDSII